MKAGAQMPEGPHGSAWIFRAPCRRAARGNRDRQNMFDKNALSTGDRVSHDAGLYVLAHRISNAPRAREGAAPTDAR